MAIEGAKTLPQCRQRLKEKLDSCFVRKDDLDPRKRFARRGVTREIFEQDRLEHFLQLLCQDSTDVFHRMVTANLKSVAEKIRGSADSPPSCNNVLAILLYSQCTDQTLRSFVESLLHERSSKLASDCDLPLTKPTACEAFGKDDGNNFWEHQFLFCPVILKERDEVTYVDHKQSCPRPFLEEPERIGQGAYAIVYKVRIEKGHLTNDQGVNERNEYAMKEFIGYDAEARRSFEAEGTIIKQFIQSAKSHENIATTKASLEWGNTYSLFFELAKCNLWEYFMEDTDTLKTLEDKQRVFGQSIGLAGALAYLHDELYLASSNEPIQCYHLDLKPQNILVFETSGIQIWKISDFGISQIKHIPVNPSGSEHHVSFLDKIFQSKKPDKDPSSGVDNSRYGGTYAAPEAKEKSGNVTRKSDVWSLACVITLVLTFLHNRAKGILNFQESRGRDRSHDWFFDSKALKSGSEHKDILHVSVSMWLNTLNEESPRKDKTEAKATRMATELLRDRMFLRDQEKRFSAKDVEKELKKIRSSFTDLPEGPAKSVTSKIPGRLSIPSPWFRHPKESHTTTKANASWKFDIPNAYGRCRFSADGRYLCIANNDVMTIKRVSGVLQGQASETDTSFASPRDKQWADFSIGSKYICAVPDSEFFEFSYLPLSREDNVDRCDVSPNVKCRIRKVVISPDDQITAFVLEDSQRRRQTWRVALYLTHDLLGLPMSSKASVKTHGSSSLSIISAAASSQEDLPWKDIIRRSPDSELPVGTSLVDLKFSSNSNILIGITEPFDHREIKGMQYEVITWNVINGRRFSTLENQTTGYDDMGESWAIDDFAVFATQPSFVAISKKKIRWGDCKSPIYKTQSKLISDELLDVLATDEEDEVVVVGRSNGKAPIVAFRISASRIKDLESLGHGFSTHSRLYNRVTDCCCLLERDDKLVIMMAVIDKREGKLYQTFLE